VEEKGLYFLLRNFNLGLYAICENAPLYVGKIFLGTCYGIIIGFIFGFWKKEIFYNALFLFFSLLFLNKLDCINFNWKTIHSILGVTTVSFSSETFFTFINEYAIEISAIVIVAIIVKKTIAKHQNFLV
jgi:uncharacterized membrane protein (Fun14 family)